ncbi:MAG: type II secretion system F family protein [Candidatus Diapherotrites archaeon]
MENEVLFYYAKFALLGAGASLAMFFLLAGTSLIIVPIIAFAGPLVLAYYLKNRAIKGLEDNFRVLLDDLRDLLQAGVNISDALQITARNDYGPLSVYVKRLAAKVKLGIPFEKAMQITFKDVRSQLIRKIITVINQTLRTGGNFMKVFTTSAKYVEKIERLKNQRKSRTMSTLFNAYMMFYVFVMIIIAIQVYFVPLIANQPAINAASLLSGDISSMQAGSSESKPKMDFSAHFLNLLIVQSIFAGPMIGKISENSLVAGLKHCLILLSTSVTAYLLATSILAPGV